MIDLDRTADAWRFSLRQVDEDLFWLKQHREVVRAGIERPEYIAYAKRRIADRLQSYRMAVRRVSEYEAAMVAAGHPFHRSEEHVEH